MSKRKPIDRSGYVYGYPRTLSDGRVALDAGDGRSGVLGYGHVVGRSRIKPGSRGSWISSELVSYNFTIDGKRYHGRGYGEGMSLTLRPMKSK